MPTRAQDGNRRGPLAALLIVLSLFLGSATAAASADVRGPSTRLGSSRHNAAAALLPSGARNSPDEEVSGAGGGQSLLPCGPAILTESLSARPLPEVPSVEWAAIPRPGSASYRARAPPAS